MIDVVYIVGKNTCCNFCELKYSFRSIEKHLQNFRNVFVIGEKPFWINSNNVTVIPYKDIHKNKARNIMCKILRAAMDERISDDFMLWNDDYFLLADTSAINYPYYYKNTLSEAAAKNIGEYLLHIEQTRRVLYAHGLSELNFDSHYPIIYNKKKFVEVVERYDWSVPYGMISKSIYCNTLKIKGEFLEDCKISHPYQLKQIQAVNANRHIFSIADAAYNVYMKKYLNDLFPNKSRFEI